MDQPGGGFAGLIPANEVDAPLTQAADRRCSGEPAPGGKC
jgi:hypothetical protein